MATSTTNDMETPMTKTNMDLPICAKKPGKTCFEIHKALMYILFDDLPQTPLTKSYGIASFEARMIKTGGEVS